MAFILSVRVPGYMERKKAILVQAKKIATRTQNSTITYLSSWPIDLEQAKRLRSTTFSYFFLYGPEYDHTMTRVIPTTSVLGILKANNRTSIIRKFQALPSSHSLSDFLLLDFIGCWVGDENKETLTIAEGKNPEFRIGHIIDITVAKEPVTDIEDGQL